MLMSRTNYVYYRDILNGQADYITPGRVAQSVTCLVKKKTIQHLVAISSKRVKLMGKNIITIVYSKNILIWTYD